MSITDSNVSNMFCEYNRNIPDIIYGTNLMKKTYTGFNVIAYEQWKCDMILKLTVCMVLLRD